MSKAKAKTITNAPNVILLADRLTAQSEHRKEWTIADVRRIHAPAFTALPFVTRKEVSDKLSQAISFWNDIPSGDGMSDYKRGRIFAGMVVDAIATDQCGSRPLERAFEAIILDAVARRVKGGKHSRTLPPAVDGFLLELSKVIATKSQSGAA